MRCRQRSRRPAPSTLPDCRRQAGLVEVSGTATARDDASINGTIGIWLSIFRYMRPDGATNHVTGRNIMLPLKAEQTAAATVKAFTKTINSGADHTRKLPMAVNYR